MVSTARMVTDRMGLICKDFKSEAAYFLDASRLFNHCADSALSHSRAP